MTLETCISDFEKIFDKTATYDGGKVIFEFYTHGDAMTAVYRARAALAEMKRVAEVGNV